MAQKRMINKVIVDADMFVDLSAESQALYFHMNLKADDEGFVAGPNKLLRMLGIKRERLQELVDRDFIYILGGIALIRHWYIHNNIRKDRSKERIYKQERAQVCLDDTRIYVMVDNCRTNDGQMSAQEREEETRLDKNSIDKESRAGQPPTGDVSLPKTKLQKLLEETQDTFPYMLTPKALSEYTKQMDFECIKYAIDEAQNSGKRSIGYVRAVLNRLLREGITTKGKLDDHVRNRHGPQKHDINDGMLGSGYTQQEFDEILGRMEEI